MSHQTTSPHALNPYDPVDRNRLTSMIESTIEESTSLLNTQHMVQDVASSLDAELLARAMRLVSEANNLLHIQREKIKTLEMIVVQDEMTGLLNRRGLEEQLGRELSRVRRGQSKGCSMALFDLDGFKVINDNYGHPAGDAAIRKVGDFFRRTVRETDVMARLGGDEFALILTDIEPEQAERRTAALSDRLNNLSIEWGPNIIPLHGSYGLARCVPEDKFERLYHAADQALYRAKLHSHKRREKA